MKTLQIAPDSANTSKVLEFVENALADAGISMKISQKFLICTDEIFANIAQYSRATTAEIRCDVGDGSAMLEFCDDGTPYNPLETAAPDTTLSAAERTIGGYGIHIVKKLMDDVKYEYRDGRNVFRISKQL